MRLVMKVLQQPSFSIRWFAHLAILSTLLIATYSPLMPVRATEHAVVLSGTNLVQALRQGGYSIYFRHEATDWSQADKVQKTDDWLSCDGSRIRQLSTAGRQSAAATGRAIRALAIPIGPVYASPYCRTVETAKLMDLGEVKPSNDVINLRVADYFGGRAAVVATARALLAKRPPDQLNTVIVAHGNVAQASTPVYPGEGEGVVFAADGGGGMRFIGRLSPTEWKQLAEELAPLPE
ncbi:MAG: hypothetical protein ACI9LO_002568 [Planctomycetota bacterium]|jgi:hypothetical protein